MDGQDFIAARAGSQMLDHVLDNLPDDTDMENEREALASNGRITVALGQACSLTGSATKEQRFLLSAEDMELCFKYKKAGKFVNEIIYNIDPHAPARDSEWWLGDRKKHRRWQMESIRAGMLFWGHPAVVQLATVYGVSIYVNTVIGTLSNIEGYKDDQKGSYGVWFKLLVMAAWELKIAGQISYK